MEQLNALIGRWTTEATHPAFPDTVVAGSAEFEWLPGERFVVERALSDHPDFPDSLAVIGEVDERLELHYFDSRGVHRVYRMEIGDGVWTIWRDAPGFSQRFRGAIEADTLAGVWQLSRDGSTWDDDLEITYRRVASM